MKKRINPNRYMVFYVSPTGERDGVEVIVAHSRPEAIDLYRRYFNYHGELFAVPRLEVV